MAHSRPKRFTNWYLREWVAATKVTQADLVGKTGYTKTAISLLMNDRQDYNPAYVRDLADALNIAPYELFMHPDDAMALRRLRKDAISVVENSRPIERAEGSRTGTDG